MMQHTGYSSIGSVPTDRLAGNLIAWQRPAMSLKRALLRAKLLSYSASPRPTALALGGTEKESRIINIVPPCLRHCRLDCLVASM